MDKKKVKVVSTQIYDTHQDSQEKIVEATMGERNGAYYLLFQEIDEETKAITKNTLKIKDGKVSLKRSGGLGTDLEFDLHKDYHTLYQTAYCEMDIVVHTKYMKLELQEKSITIQLHYEIMMQGEKISDNIYTIKE